MTALGETTTDARKALLAGKTVVFFGYVPCRLSPARNGTLQVGQRLGRRPRRAVAERSGRRLDH